MFQKPSYIKNYKDYKERMEQVTEILPDMLIRDGMKQPLVRMLTICGDSGCGKTYNVDKFTSQHTNDYDIFRNNSEISPIILHQKLFKHPKGLLVLDECDSLFKLGKNTLKVAADSSSKRMVSYAKFVRGQLLDCTAVGTNPEACQQYINDQAEAIDQVKYPEKYRHMIEEVAPQSFEFGGSIILLTNLSKIRINEMVGSDALATRGRMVEFKFLDNNAWRDVLITVHAGIDNYAYASNPISNESKQKALDWIQSSNLDKLLTTSGVALSFRYFGECATQFEVGRDEEYLTTHFNDMMNGNIR